MERFKQFAFKNFEAILVFAILLSAFLGTYFLDDHSIVLNFYYLPVLVASYFLGRRMGLLTAIMSILLVLVCALLFPSRFFSQNMLLQDIGRLSSWGGFLILASVTVGSLYERNERRLHDLKNAYVGIVEILSKYLESTDRYTKGHSVRVSELAMDMAIALDLHRTDVDNIRVAGLLHDIGKIEVSGQILRKAADLTTEEREQINKHTEKGARILSSVGSVLKDVVPIVMAHHEYFSNNDNGQKNSKDVEIPLGARILAVADSFDAMTSDRPYRKGMPPWQAREQIIVNSGKQFDPRVVEAFKLVVDKKMETI
ncbi:MAG TPA: HD domain-containing phosphohydrolase [Syntrophales bacterium]|nr:HD domain-containing phosphohydrolase [Syntrophales bacterium]